MAFRFSKKIINSNNTLYKNLFNKYQAFKNEVSLFNSNIDNFNTSITEYIKQEGNNISLESIKAKLLYVSTHYSNIKKPKDLDINEITNLKDLKMKRLVNDFNYTKEELKHSINDLKLSYESYMQIIMAEYKYRTFEKDGNEIKKILEDIDKSLETKSNNILKDVLKYSKDLDNKIDNILQNIKHSDELFSSNNLKNNYDITFEQNYTDELKKGYNEFINPYKNEIRKKIEAKKKLINSILADETLKFKELLKKYMEKITEINVKTNKINFIIKEQKSEEESGKKYNNYKKLTQREIVNKLRYDNKKETKVYNYKNHKNFIKIKDEIKRINNSKKRWVPIRTDLKKNLKSL